MHRQPGLAAKLDLDVALAAAVPCSSDGDRRLAVSIYRMLATGRPVRVASAAAQAGRDVKEAEYTLASWPAVFYDDLGDVVGFWGLCLSPTPHRLRVGSGDVFAWCAWDPFFLARIIGPIDVRTDDPVTGATIAYHLTERGELRRPTHRATALSLLRPDLPWRDDVLATFCHYVHHFVDTESARRWTAAHPGTFVIGVADAEDLAGRYVARAFGTALGDGRANVRTAWRRGGSTGP
jgi:hypothetical protein